MDEKILFRQVSGAKLLNAAAILNEDIESYPAGGDRSEYLRGQVELICDAVGLPIDEYRDKVAESIAARVRRNAERLRAPRRSGIGGGAGA